MSINAMISPYTEGIKYIIIGASITLLPFLIFLTSYNYVLAKRDIDRIIDYWIYLRLFFVALLL